MNNTNTTTNATLPESGAGQRYVFALPPPELHYYHVTYLSLAIAVGVPGNTLVLAAYAALKLKTSCDWYILHIAVLDLMICLFRVPTHLAMETGHWQGNGSDALCKFVYWLSQSVITASVILFAFIAMDRYIKVCKPSVKITARFSRNCVLVISGLSLLSALPNFWMYANNAQGGCVVQSTVVTMDFMRSYYTALFASFLLMLLVVVVCYTFIIKKVRQSQKVMKAHQNQGKVGKSLTGKKSRDGHSGADSGIHTSNPSGGCWTTHTDAPSLQQPGSFNHSLAALHLRLPMKAWQESDHNIHEKAQGAQLVSFSLVNEGPAPPENNPGSVPNPPLSIPEMTSRENDVHTDDEWNLQASSESKNPAEDGQVDVGQVSSSAAVGDVEKSADADEDTGNSLPTSKSLVEEDLCKDSTSTREGKEQTLAATDNAESLPQNNNHSAESAQVEENGTNPPLDEAANKTDGNMNPTAQTGEEGQASLRETIPQGRRGLRNPFRRNHQVHPLRTRLTPPSSLSQQHASGIHSAALPSDDGQTNFSPKLSRNTVVSRATVQRNSRSFRLTLLLLLVTIVFIVSWIPPYVAMVWFFYVGYTPPLSSSDVALQKYAPTGYVLNHFANPIIYLALSSSFRENVADLWRRFVRFVR